MEFNKKLQALRKQSGLTQEALAEKIYVSRAAISKWESGRGYPSVDSLKDLAKFFSVTVDELISGTEALRLAEKCEKEKSAERRNLVFAFLDVCVSLLFVMPLFALRGDESIKSVALFNLIDVRLYLKILYVAFSLGTVFFGIVMFALQNCRKPLWMKSKHMISVLLSIAALLLFVINT